MNLTQSEIDRMVTMSRIANYTNEDNRAYHHAMIDAGWNPVIGEEQDMIEKWMVYDPKSSWDYDAARKHYDAGGDCRPTPF